MTIKHLGGIFGRNPEFSNISIEDNGKATFGNSEDLQIFHDGSNSYVKDAGTGALHLQGGGAVRIQSPISEDMIVATANSGVGLYTDGDRKILTTTTGANLTGNLHIINDTPPASSQANGCILFTEDVSASSELKVRDEAGNVTTLSPHNFDLIPQGPSEDMAWSYYSEKDGKRINVDMLKAIRVLEKMSGEQLVYED